MSDFKHQNPMADDQEHVEDDSKTFPMKLVEILADERYQDAISWLPHGRAFIVRNRKLFAEQVMPLHFSRKAKYSSFTRKLNRWNFVRVSSGPEIGAYYHEFFLRDKPHLAAQMFCKNARTKLAMADDSVPKPTAAAAAAVLEEQERQMCPYGRPGPSTTSARPQVTSSAQQQPVPQYASSLLQSMQKDGDNKFQNLGVANNLQLLERQMQFLQEEHAQRMLLQRMAANRLQQAQLLQQQAAAGLPMGPMSNPGLAMPGFNAGAMAAAAAASAQVPGMDDSSSGGLASMNAEQQQAQIQRMRQMMELRNRQRQGLAPTNARASAA